MPPDPDDQLRRIRIALDRHHDDVHLCRMGKSDEWIALGLGPALDLPFSPSLRYSNGRWVASTKSFQTLIDQALGELTHDHRNGDQNIQPRRSRHRRSA